MKQITCPHCADTYPDFDVAHVCSKGPYAPKLKSKMNERIKLLAEQAGLRFTQLMSNPMVPVVDGKETDLEKFAELIVQECINEIAYIGKANEVFGDRTDRGGLNHILWTTETAIEKIKEHFGVEE